MCMYVCMYVCICIYIYIHIYIYIYVYNTSECINLRFCLDCILWVRCSNACYMYVRARAQDGWTCLHVASEKGHVEVVKYLHEHGSKSLVAQANNVRDSRWSFRICLVCVRLSNLFGLCPSVESVWFVSVCRICLVCVRLSNLIGLCPSVESVWFVSVCHGVVEFS
jgi:hypothetical protein